MSYYIKLLTLLIIFISVYHSQLFSQVTIGSGIKPVSGALLDLKENNITNGSNSTKGLLYPRVYLTDRTSLVDIANGTLTAMEDPARHTGLTVYNVNPDFAGKIGLNVWDGTKWANLKPDTIVSIKRDTIINIRRDTIVNIKRDTVTVNISMEFLTFFGQIDTLS